METPAQLENTLVDNPAMKTVNNRHLFRFTPQNGSEFRIYEFANENSSLRGFLRRLSLLSIEKVPNNTEWVHIIWNRLSGYIHVPNGVECHPRFQLIHRVRRFELWDGDNVFLLNGKVMLGKDYSFFVTTNVLAIISLCVYYSSVIPMVIYWPVWTLFSLILVFFTFKYLWLAGTTEPGILLRNNPTIKVSCPESQGKNQSTYKV